MWIALYLLVLCILAALLYMVYTLRKLVFNTTYNDVYELMTELMYKVFERLDDGEAAKAMRSFYRDQRDDLYNRYLDAKRRGVEILKDDNFLQDVIGCVKADLNRYYGFSDSYCEEIEAAGVNNLQRFLEHMLVDAGSRRNYRKALKQNMLLKYEKTILEYYEIYKSHYKQEIVVQTTDKIGYMRFVSRVEIDKNEAKKAIGRGEVFAVADVLLSMPNFRDDNKLLLMRSRLSDYEKAKFSGTHEAYHETELNKIKESLLNYIDKI